MNSQVADAKALTEGTPPTILLFTTEVVVDYDDGGGVLLNVVKEANGHCRFRGRLIR